MPKIAYIERNFRADSLALIAQANRVLEDLSRQGYEITLRMLYYQLVSANVIRNKQTEYDRLGSLMNDARMAGLVDWSHLADRTRNVYALPHYSSPAALIRQNASKFNVDRWEGQIARPQVWVEKEALFSVISRPAIRYDVPHFACKGYVSVSEMWSAARRIIEQLEEGYEPVIIHLGDHDPSGLHMSVDNLDRLATFIEYEYGERGAFDLKRIALNRDQVEQYNPPPNPAKQTDSRFASYQKEHGDQSWELDALRPDVIDELISNELEDLIDDFDAWYQRAEDQDLGRKRLSSVSRHWAKIEEYVDTLETK